MDALGTLNFRDVGGIRVRGGAVRRGVLYRSEGPASFDAAHRAALVALGFRVVCDLRSATEQERAPNDWVQGARFLNFDIITDIRAQRDSGWDGLRANPSADSARRSMAANYRAMPAALSPHLPRFVDAVVAGETPVLVHCTAGKDRTGVMIALLLQVLGASDEEIRRDYLRSEIFGRKRRSHDTIRATFEKGLGYAPDDAMVQAMVGVDLAYIDAMLDEVAEKWGSVEEYFAASGVDNAKRAAFVAALVEPHGE